ncbi:MAG TPA: hypothetical protein PLX69_04065 [Leptospiraceae bacterium]|nr:hypothetical protein [Leptospiraceae bacterium]HRG73711.1 hypothetical protein [Leptospiraceae bacterium]
MIVKRAFALTQISLGKLLDELVSHNSSVDLLEKFRIINYYTMWYR